MAQAIAAVIVAPASPFRDALESNLCPPAFSVVATKTSLSDINRGELPRSDPYLIVIECGEGPGTLIAQIAELKQQNPLARVAVVGQRWKPSVIATAFEAGVNAYFAEVAVSKELLQALNLLTR
jgi:DNA-binding NarL/FixJ family response regulator